MSPRTFDEIPVSTVFAEEKSREVDDEVEARKISIDSKSSTKSNQSRNRKTSRDSKKSEKNQKINEQAIDTAKTLKKELEDTIRNQAIYIYTTTCMRRPWVDILLTLGGAFESFNLK